MIINTNKITTYEFSFTNQDIEALKRVNELFESIDSELTEEGNPDYIVDSDGRICIDVKVFGETCETIINLLNFHRWEACQGLCPIYYYTLNV